MPQPPALHPSPLCCPLCPTLAQSTVQQLALHLANTHQLRHSGFILARIMCASPQTYAEVREVLRDVGSISDLLKIKNTAIHDLNLKKFKLKVEIVKNDECSQTDPEFMSEQKLDEKVSNEIQPDDFEIAKLQQDIADKKSNVNVLNTQIIDIEDKLGSHKKEEADNAGEGQTVDTKVITEVLVDELDNEIQAFESSVLDEMQSMKAVSSEKFDKIDKLNDQIVGLKSRLTLLEIKEIKVEKHLKLHKNRSAFWRLEVDKLTKEKVNDTSTKLIESQRIVHEKEIQNLNLKLQNQINRSQELKAREKSLMEDVEALKTATFKRQEQIVSLANQVNVLQDKLAKRVENDEEAPSADLKVILGKEVEIYELHEKIANLDGKTKRLEKEVEHFKDQLQRKKEDNFELKHSMNILKDSTDAKISEAEKKIVCLRKEVDCINADANIIVEENERYSKEKLSLEQIIESMKSKFCRYREILDLMKESLAGLTSMHEDTSEKLIEAVMNTAQTSQMVLKDVKKQLRGFEKEVNRFEGEERIPFDKKVGNNNVTMCVKKEPCDDPVESEDDFGMEGSRSTSKEGGKKRKYSK